MDQYLRNEWKPNKELAEHFIQDRESKIMNEKIIGHLKAIIFFILGIIFSTCLLIILEYFSKKG